MIQLQNFTKSYGTFIAVENVSFIAPSNSITAIAGLNGAGKTTILKAICSVHYADSGSVFVNGFDAMHDSIQNKAQIGFVTEHPIFYDDFTVIEFLEFDAKILLNKLHENFFSEVIDNAIVKTSIQDVLHKKIKTLSKGYRQRLALARALLTDTKVLILDEPTSGLDPRQIVQIRTLIEDLGKEKTILLSTHIMQEIEALCSAIAIIHEGRLISFGSEKDICRKTGEKNIENSFLKLTDKGVIN